MKHYHLNDIKVAWNLMSWHMTNISQRNLLIALEYLKSEQYENTSKMNYQIADVHIKRELKGREFPDE